MKRGEPLKRTVGLARGATPLPRAALRRGRPLSTRSADTREARQQPAGGANGTEWPQDTRDRVSSRSQGRCEARASDDCTGQATDLHHRQRRREGRHGPSNALHVDRACHAHIHAHPQDSRAAGWIVSAFSRPESTPVLINGNRWCLLDGEGGYLTDVRGWPLP